MARKLNIHFLNALRSEFPFLKDWEPDELNSASRPITFEVKKTLEPTAAFHLEYGRHNNSVDSSYTNGVTGVGVSNGKNLVWKELDEGTTVLSDVIEADTRYLLVKHVYKSMLVYDNPGSVSYVLYKVVPTQEVLEDEANAAQRMKAELEG